MIKAPDREEWRQWMRALTAPLASALAASAAERLFLSFDFFEKEGDLSDKAEARAHLDCIWSWAEHGGVRDPEGVRVCEQSLKAMATRLSKDKRDRTKYAQASVECMYAASAVYSHGVEAAEWAIQTAYEALDHFVNYQLGVDYAAHGEAAVLSHPLVQRELRMQLADLSFLQAVVAGVEPQRSWLEVLRARAEINANLAFTDRDV